MAPIKYICTITYFGVILQNGLCFTINAVWGLITSIYPQNYCPPSDHSIVFSADVKTSNTSPVVILEVYIDCI